MAGRTWRAVVVLGFATLLALVTTSPASAAPVTVGDWRFDEPAGAAVARDSSGGGRNGVNGSDVETGLKDGATTFYRFPYLPYNAGIHRPEHLVKIKDNPALDPGTSNFSITIRFRTDVGTGNMVQKGQGATAGGYWKLELTQQGRVRCTWRDANRQTRTLVTREELDDGTFRTVRCERTAGRIAVYVDGKIDRRWKVATGPIDNNWEMSVGGKSRCDARRVSCDYYVGDIDFVRVTKG